MLERERETETEREIEGNQKIGEISSFYYRGVYIMFVMSGESRRDPKTKNKNTHIFTQQQDKE